MHALILLIIGAAAGGTAVAAMFWSQIHPRLDALEAELKAHVSDAEASLHSAISGIESRIKGAPPAPPAPPPPPPTPATPAS